MKKNDVYGYIRVSDTKQIDGASLSEQQRAIIEYAKKNRLKIIKWFEETKTAAKRGRPKFTEMLSLLKSGQAGGVVMHKIDRSARNLHDWASVGDLIDNGIQVHFAHESLDMTERGGRLSADIQAVMASDYVRNLRQEIIKGINGRLNQGLYPFRAPLGYLNNGRGKVKTKDPKRYLHIQKLFELYGTRNYTVKKIEEILYQDGLRNFGGNRVKYKSLYKLLKKPFYAGLIEVKGKMYSGIHEPLISKELFQQSQDAIKGRYRKKGIKHNYLYRQLIRCHNCNYLMSGENQKGNVYYRCSTKDCPTKTRREDYISRKINEKFKLVSLSDEEIESMEEIINEFEQNGQSNEQSTLQKIQLTKGKLNLKQEKLLEAYLENLIDSDIYQIKRNKIVDEINTLELKEREFTTKQPLNEKIKNLLELCKHLKIPHDLANHEEKRRLLKITTSNLTVFGKSLYFKLLSPFDEFYKMAFLPQCEHSADTTRKIRHKIFHSDKPDIIFTNEWTSHVERPILNKEELVQLCNRINKIVEYMPTIDELLYSEYDP